MDNTMEKIKKFEEFVEQKCIEIGFKSPNNELYEIASVGYFSTLKNNGKPESPKFKVFVNGSEGNEPHMHIWDDSTNGKKFHTCVCLNKIAYFHHDGKEDILTPKQKEFLVKFLKSECKKNKRYKTNWEYALSMWNDNNTDKTQVDENSEVLDYTLLENNETNKIKYEKNIRNK